MLDFKQLSFWEKQQITEDIDFLVVGSGIVGTSCALHLRDAYPDAKIVLLERGYLPSGASTKNAGFACFGSLTELDDDLKTLSKSTVWDTVALRYEGLIQLMERFPKEAIDYRNCGSFDLMDLGSDTTRYIDKIPEFNDEIQRISGKTNCYSWKTDFVSNYGFQGFSGGFFNRLEGAIDTGKLWRASHQLLVKNNILCLHGIEVHGFHFYKTHVVLDTNCGELTSKKVGIATNGLSQHLLPEMDVKPARAQVVVTSEIPNLTFDETFHYQQGYYYFRTVGNRILLGGGRNLNFDEETTTSFETTPLIQDALVKLLSEKIIPNTSFTIDFQWSGIMGVGSMKKPIIEKIDANCAVGIRMGGMGVAIGSEVGRNLAQLMIQ